jgi:hypothetical protein
MRKIIQMDEQGQICTEIKARGWINGIRIPKTAGVHAGQIGFGIIPTSYPVGADCITNV